MSEVIARAESTGTPAVITERGERAVFLRSDVDYLAPSQNSRRVLSGGGFKDLRAFTAVCRRCHDLC